MSDEKRAVPDEVWALVRENLKGYLAADRLREELQARDEALADTQAGHEDEVGQILSPLGRGRHHLVCDGQLYRVSHTDTGWVIEELGPVVILPSGPAVIELPLPPSVGRGLL